jgi:uncharacterized peroxidase-related enzyme
MSSIHPIALGDADAATSQALNAVKAKLGAVPNMLRTLARSPVALNAYMQLSGVVSAGTLPARQREKLALVVAEQNACGYCLAAHHALAGLAGLNADEIHAARDGRSNEPREAALLDLASAIVREQGKLSADVVARFKARGLSDADILEVLANVVLNIFTNYTNHIAGTEIDFPPVALTRAA